MGSGASSSSSSSSSKGRREELSSSKEVVLQSTLADRRDQGYSLGAEFEVVLQRPQLAGLKAKQKCLLRVAYEALVLTSRDKAKTPLTYFKYQDIICWGSTSSLFQFKVFGTAMGRTEPVAIMLSTWQGKELEQRLMASVHALMQDMKREAVTKQDFNTLKALLSNRQSHAGGDAAILLGDGGGEEEEEEEEKEGEEEEEEGEGAATAAAGVPATDAASSAEGEGPGVVAAAAAESAAAAAAAAAVGGDGGGGAEGDGGGEEEGKTKAGVENDDDEEEKKGDEGGGVDAAAVAAALLGAPPSEVSSPHDDVFDAPPSDPLDAEEFISTVRLFVAGPRSYTVHQGVELMRLGQAHSALDAFDLMDLGLALWQSGALLNRDSYQLVVNVLACPEDRSNLIARVQATNTDRSSARLLRPDCPDAGGGVTTTSSASASGSRRRNHTHRGPSSSSSSSSSSTSTTAAAAATRHGASGAPSPLSPLPSGGREVERKRRTKKIKEQEPAAVGTGSRTAPRKLLRATPSGPLTEK